MAKLNQIIAVENGVKTKTQREITELHRKVQKDALLNGINRTYQPKDDEGDKLPSESTRVQVRVGEVLDEVSSVLTRLFDVTFTKESGNKDATADIVIDNTTLVAGVPVTYLLFLEKQLVDIHTFVAKLPTLDPASEWEFDTNENVWKTKPVSTTRSKKVPRNWVKAEATDKHPAQVEIFHEDVIVGYWTKVDTSGAIPASRRAELLERVEKLQSAVKFAREEANNVEVADVKIGQRIFGYLFA